MARRTFYSAHIDNAYTSTVDGCRGLDHFFLPRIFGCCPIDGTPGGVICKHHVCRSPFVQTRDEGPSVPYTIARYRRRAARALCPTAEMRCRRTNEVSMMVGINAGERPIVVAGALVLALRPSLTMHTLHENDIYIPGIYLYTYHKNVPLCCFASHRSMRIAIGAVHPLLPSVPE